MKKFSLVALIVIVFSFVVQLSPQQVSVQDNVITVWSGVTGPDGDLIRQNIDEYNAMNPAFPVELLAMEGSTLNSRLVTATRSGEGIPDLALVPSETVTQYAGQSLLEPWDALIEGTEVNAENYLEEAWNVGTVDGTQYGLPATIGTWVMYYNQDLVDQYVPGATDDDIITYEEVTTAGETAKADGIIANGFG